MALREPAANCLQALARFHCDLALDEVASTFSMADFVIAEQWIAERERTHEKNCSPVLTGANEMSDEIKTSEGRVVGTWNGISAQELMQELGRIRKQLAAEKSSDKLAARDMPHREQIPEALQAFKAYALWGCDKTGACLVGAGANRLEPVEKVLAFSLVEHH